jgi:two-component system NtrC family sensor kinase
MRLLSMVATHAAVVLANARFFAMVERAKEQWETAFDALREGIAVVDAAGRVQRANRALAELLGRDMPALVGDDLSAALFGRSPLLADLLALAGEGNRPPPLVARSGRLDRTLRLNAARIPSAAPTRSVVVLVEDVTDEQSMEAQLIQSEKLAAVGQLVSGVAHELNNPLTSIAGLSELLLEQREGGPKDRDHLQVIHEQAERAGRIVRNLLTFARPGSGDALPVDIGEVVRRTLQLMSYDLRIKNIRVVQDLAPELPAVLGDRNALQQVVLNLLSNAAHAVQHLPAEAVRTITVRTWADTQVHLRVADTGPGVAETIAPQIFTPFFTTKEPGKGTGLGLSIT